MLKALRFEITSPYSKIESWGYDRIGAPAVARLQAEVLDGFVRGLRDCGRILDVGCGGGQIAALLAAARSDVSIIGLDPLPEQIQRAIARTSTFRGRVRFVIGSVQQLPFENSCFDVLISIASLKHWPQKRKALEECLRVLKPGGEFTIIEADRNCSNDAARNFVAHWRLPRFLRPLAFRFFKRFVAGNSIGVNEAAALLEGLPVVQSDVRTLFGLPALIITGAKPTEAQREH